MYTIKVDGQTLYAPALSEEYSMVLSPKLELEVNRPGSLTFTLPHGHAMRGSIHKMRSVITVERDGEEVFRGRASEVTIDLYDQAEYYCEGELSFLLDSVQRPTVYNCTAEEFLRMLIVEHNAQVESYKRFTVGRVTAVDATDTLDFENTTYHDTSGEIGMELLERFGGYLVVRNEGGTRYLDYLESLEETSGQQIGFGVNLLDLENVLEARDIFTVLIPLGRTESSSSHLTIADVNGGLDYIENAEGIAQYGRITKTHTWDDIDDPGTLLEKGREKLNASKVADTLTLTAVDLQMAGVDTDRLWVGYKIRFYSEPHGINRYEACMKMSVDMENPENNQYVFGTVPATLADGVNAHTRTLQDHDSRIRETEHGLSINLKHYDELKNSMSEVLLELDAMNATILLKADRTELEELEPSQLEARISAVEIALDGANARIDLLATREELNELSHKISEAEILIDGANAAISLKASQTEVNKLTERVSAAEIDIDGANAAIALKANQSVVFDLEERLSDAEILIDGANAKIALKANQSTVNDMEERLSSAEIDIDGANAAISLKASKTEVNKLTERVSDAEVLIDAANGQIALKASTSTVNALDNRVSTAEFTIKSMESEIALKADTILLQGYVKANELETEVLEVVNASYIETLAAGFIGCGDINAETVNCDAINAGPIEADSLVAPNVSANYGVFNNGIDIGGKSVTWKNLTVPHNLTGLSKTYTDIWYMDSDGTEQYARVLTNVELRMSGSYTYNFAVSAT